VIKPSPSPRSRPSNPVHSAIRSALLIPVRGCWLDLLAVAFLFALALLLLWRQIVLGGALYDDDMMLMSIPVYSWYSDQLKQGILPLWSHAMEGGAPLAFVIYDFFYPPDILIFRLLDGARGFHLSLAIHGALAGSCTYWYCRVLGLRRLPSLVAAVAFQMGNEVLAWPSNGFVTKTLFVLPGLLAAVELTFRRSPRYWLLVPVLVSMALLGGYAQVVLFGLAAAGAYALTAVAARAGDLGARWGVYRLSLLALGVVLGLGLAAVRVAPTMALVSLSTREGGLNFERAAVDSIEPLSVLLGYFLPVVSELPGRFAARPDYVGVAALMLAGLALGAGRQLGRVGGFHVGLVAVALAVSMGRYTPVYGLLLSLPFFSLFRGANRFSLVAALGISVLAAYALDLRLARALALRTRRYRAVAAVGIVGAVVAIALLLLGILLRFGGTPLFDDWRRAVLAGHWDLLSLLRVRVAVTVLGLVAFPLLLIGCARRWISHRVLEWSALVLTAATLLFLGWVQNRWMPPAVLREPPAFVGVLKSDPERFRVFAWAPGTSTYNVGAFYEGIVGHLPSREFEARYFRQFIPPNLGIAFGIDNAEWYDALQTRRQALLTNYMGSERGEYGRFADGEYAEWKVHTLSLHDRLNLLAAMNVKYLTNAFPIQDPRLELVDEVSVQIYPNLPAVAKVYLYRLKNALPRAFVVPAVAVMPREQDVMETLLAGSVDLKQRVILEQQPPRMEDPALTPAGSSVQIDHYGDRRVILRARTDGSGFLVLMDFLLPGWTATVDGLPAPILAANFAGRAVPLPGPGEHRVEFSYSPPLFREGLAASGASLLLLLAVPLTWWLRARSRP